MVEALTIAIFAFLNLSLVYKRSVVLTSMSFTLSICFISHLSGMDWNSINV